MKRFLGIQETCLLLENPVRNALYNNYRNYFDKQGAATKAMQL